MQVSFFTQWLFLNKEVPVKEIVATHYIHRIHQTLYFWSSNHTQYPYTVIQPTASISDVQEVNSNHIYLPQRFSTATVSKQYWFKYCLSVAAVLIEYRTTMSASQQCAITICSLMWKCTNVWLNCRTMDRLCLLQSTSLHYRSIHGEATVNREKQITHASLSTAIGRLLWLNSSTHPPQPPLPPALSLYNSLSPNGVCVCNMQTKTLLKTTLRNLSFGLS